MQVDEGRLPGEGRMRFKIVETDNHGGDYPDEKFLNLPSLSERGAKEIAYAINEHLCYRDNDPRYWKVRPKTTNFKEDSNRDRANTEQTIPQTGHRWHREPVSDKVATAGFPFELPSLSSLVPAKRRVEMYARSPVRRGVVRVPWELHRVQRQTQYHQSTVSPQIPC